MTKNELIDQINDAFISIIAKENNKQYGLYLKRINKKIIDNVDDLTPSKLKAIVNSENVNIKNSVLLFSVLNAILLIMNNKKLTKKEKDNLAPIIAVLGIYAITRPKHTTTRLVKIVNNTKGLNDNEKKVKKLLNQYFKENEKAISKANKAVDSNLKKSTSKYASNVTKSIRKDISKAMRQEKDIDVVRKELNKKYTVKSSVIDRNLNTEIHAQAETVKLEFSKESGFTHKTWKTQGDSRVRETKWHIAVANKRIPIDSDFRSGGLVASRPGDPRLPAGERIRCRCYLIYD